MGTVVTTQTTGLEVLFCNLPNINKVGNISGSWYGNWPRNIPKGKEVFSSLVNGNTRKATNEMKPVHIEA